MTYRILVCVAVMALTACQSRPVAQQPGNGPVSPSVPEEPAKAVQPLDETSQDQPSVANVDAANPIPPCLPEAPRPKVAVKRRSHPLQSTEKPTAVEMQPPRVGSANPEVKPIDMSVASILGKRVQGAEGEDLGRVVDVQADGSGRVRLVIIEFGGFLGVGNRRAAIDWGLLRFHPDDPDHAISLTVNAKVVQGAPEYRQTSHPRALMAPVTAPAVDSSPPTSTPPPQIK